MQKSCRPQVSLFPQVSAIADGRDFKIYDVAASKHISIEDNNYE